MKIRHLLVIGITGVLLAGCCSSRPVAQKWEYKVITAHMYQELQPELNKAGADGWELVSAVNRDLYATVVLKRPKKGDESVSQTPNEPNKIASPEPSLPASGSGASVLQTPDSLPAPGSSGGR